MKILIIKPSSLGDIIHGLQVAQSIREQVQYCEIHWVVKDRFKEVIERCTAVDRSYIYRRRGGVKSFLRLIREIRQEKYDYVLDFQGLFRSGVMMGLSKGDVKIGRSDSRELACLFHHKDAPLPTQGKKSHAVEVLLNFLPEMGLRKSLLGKLMFSTPDLGTIDPRLNSKRSHILFIPHSRQQKKEWSGFKELAQRLNDGYEEELLVWDSHLDTPLPRALSKVVNTAGKTSVAQMLSLVQGAKLVIANDSGPMHIAAAMGVPVLGLFGPTPKSRFQPYPPNNGRNHVIEAPQGELGNLSVDDVFGYVEQLLK